MAKTQLEFNLVAVRGFEAEWSRFGLLQVPVPGMKTDVEIDFYNRTKSSLQRKEHEENVRFNDRVGLIQAEAKAHAAVLMVEPLLRAHRGQMQELMTVLAREHSATSDSVTERIAVYEEKQPVVITLLDECDILIESEIARAL